MNGRAAGRPLRGARVLVTGGGGFVGRHLVARLAAEGAEVVAPRRADCDVRDAAAVAALVEGARPDAVVHLAGQSSVARSFAEPLETFETNVLGTAALLEAVRARAAQARLLVVSSAEVYGAAGPESLPLDEGAPLRPASPYAASKAAAEAAALQYRRSFGLDVAVARPFNAVGPGQSTAFALASFAESLAAIARGEAEPVVRVGNLDVERDLTDVRDVARAVALLVARAEPGGVYNVCSGRAVPLREALGRLVEASGLDVRVEVDPSRLRPADVPRLVGRNERLRDATGWAPEFSLRESLAALYASRRERV